MSVRSFRSQTKRHHFDDIDASCPLVALPNDVARKGDPKVKRVFQAVFKAMVDLFDRTLHRDGRRNVEQRALALAALCVGGMVVARSLQDRELSDSLRDAATKMALEMGGGRRLDRNGDRSGLLECAVVLADGAVATRYGGASHLS
jgi:hypothetical protein